jgi:hypothetical protein
LGIGFCIKCHHLWAPHEFKKGVGYQGGGGGWILNLSLLASGGCGLVMLGLCPLSAGDLKYTTTGFGFDWASHLGYLGIRIIEST